MTRPRHAVVDPMSPGWVAVWITEVFVIAALAGVAIGSVLALWL